MDNRGKNFLKCLLPSILVLICQVVLAMDGAFLLFCKQASDYESGGFRGFMEKYVAAMTDTNFGVGVMLAYAIIATIGFSIWYNKIFVAEKTDKKILKRMTNKPSHFIVGVAIFAIGMQYLCTYFMNFLGVLFPQWLETYENLLKGMGLSEEITVPLLLYAVIIGPICEELTFRGLTMGYAKRFMSFWAANIVQAILFAGMHMNPLQSAYTFAVGIALGYFVHRTGSLWMGIILHIAFNSIGTLGSALVLSGSNPVQMFIILFGAMVATYFGFLLIEKNIPQKVNETDHQSDNSFTA